MFNEFISLNSAWLIFQLRFAIGRTKFKSCIAFKLNHYPSNALLALATEN